MIKKETYPQTLKLATPSHMIDVITTHAQMNNLYVTHIQCRS
jgi:hypothetical protein